MNTRVIHTKKRGREQELSTTCRAKERQVSYSIMGSGLDRFHATHALATIIYIYMCVYINTTAKGFQANEFSVTQTSVATNSTDSSPRPPFWLFPLQTLLLVLLLRTLWRLEPGVPQALKKTKDAHAHTHIHTHTHIRQKKRGEPIKCSAISFACLHRVISTWREK